MRLVELPHRKLKRAIQKFREKKITVVIVSQSCRLKKVERTSQKESEEEKNQISKECTPLELKNSMVPQQNLSKRNNSRK